MICCLLFPFEDALKHCGSFLQDLSRLYAAVFSMFQTKHTWRRYLELLASLCTLTMYMLFLWDYREFTIRISVTLLTLMLQHES